MTGPGPSDDAPQDLMLPFGPLADETGRDVVLSGEHADAVLGYCRAMGARFGAPGYLRYLFGLPVNEALQSGYQITQRALRETTPHVRDKLRSPVPPSNSCRSRAADVPGKRRPCLTCSPGLARWRTRTR
jgi:hypothetical protein